MFTSSAAQESDLSTQPELALVVSHDPRRRRVRDTAIAVAFAALSVAMTFPHPTQLTTRVPGDGGDALFIVWTMRWVNHSFAHGWTTLWNAPIFAGTHNVLAYSDTLLPIAPVFGVLERLTGSPAVAFNILYLAAWTLTLWCTYRLALRLTSHPASSVVAAVAFTFSTQHLAQYRHLQLVIGGLLVGILHLVVRLCDRPSLARGVLLGVAAATLTLTTTYLGLIAATTAAVLVAVRIALDADPTRRRAVASAVGTAAISAAVLLVPFALRYHEVTADARLQRHAEHQFDLSPSDLLAVSVDNHHIAQWWPVAGHTPHKTSENWAFPGYTTTTLAVCAVAYAVSHRRRPSTTQLAFGAAGVVLLVLAFGDVVHVGAHDVALPFAALRRLPGFDGIRVPVRFLIVPTLTACLAAASGLAAATRRHGRWAWAVCAVAVGLLLFESDTTIETTRVAPTTSGAAINDALAALPEGNVVELPMRTSVDGAAWAFVEVSRQLAATRDWHPRLNGHSGFEPPGWPALAAAVNTFPSPSSLLVLDQHHVRYIVIRTALPIDLGPARTNLYGKDDVGVVSPREALAMVAAIPRTRLVRVDRFGDAYLIELNDIRPSHVARPLAAPAARHRNTSI